MSDLDDFLAAHPKAPGKVCTACALFQSFPDLAAALREARSRAAPVPYGRLAAFLRSKGHRLLDYQLRDHFSRHEVKI